MFSNRIFYSIILCYTFWKWQRWSKIPPNANFVLTLFFNTKGECLVEIHRQSLFVVTLWLLIRDIYKIIHELSKTVKTVMSHVKIKLGNKKIVFSLDAQIINRQAQEKSDGFCVHISHTLSRGNKFLDSVVNGDKTFVCHHKSKRLPLQWQHTHFPKIRKFKTSTSTKNFGFSFSERSVFFWLTSCLKGKQFLPQYETLSLQRVIQNKKKRMVFICYMTIFGPILLSAA